jgi:hypothetical protein
MKRSGDDYPGLSGDYPVIPPSMPPREGPDVPDPEPEEREPIAWKQRLLEVGLALALLAALGLFVWSWMQYRGGAP